MSSHYNIVGSYSVLNLTVRIKLVAKSAVITLQPEPTYFRKWQSGGVFSWTKALSQRSWGVRLCFYRSLTALSRRSHCDGGDGRAVKQIKRQSIPRRYSGFSSAGFGIKKSKYTYHIDNLQIYHWKNHLVVARQCQWRWTQ